MNGKSKKSEIGHKNSQEEDKHGNGNSFKQKGANATRSTSKQDRIKAGASYEITNDNAILSQGINSNSNLALATATSALQLQNQDRMMSRMRLEDQSRCDEMFQATQFTFAPAGLNLMNQQLAAATAGATMSTSEVYKILGEVNKSLKDIKKDISEMKQEKTLIKTDIQSMQYDIEELQEDSAAQVKNLNACQSKVNILGGITSRLDHYLHDFNSRLLKLEAGATKKDVMISGIPEQEEEHCVKLCKDFIEKDLKITEEIRIADSYRKGKKMPEKTDR